MSYYSYALLLGLHNKQSVNESSQHNNQHKLNSSQNYFYICRIPESGENIEDKTNCYCCGQEPCERTSTIDKHIFDWGCLRQKEKRNFNEALNTVQ